MQIILGYVIGFFISLLCLHGFKRELDLDNYDPPHPAYYDDYDSNAHAYVAFSLMWPIFWFFLLIITIGRGVVKLSEMIGKLFDSLSIKTEKKKKYASNKTK